MQNDQLYYKGTDTTVTHKYRRSVSPERIEKTPVRGTVPTPTERRVMTAMERRAMTPVEREAMTPVERAAMTAMERRAMTPVERAAMTAMERRAMTPVERAAVTPVERVAMTPVERSMTPVERAMTPVERAAMTPVERVATRPFKSVAMSPIERAAITAIEKKPMTPAERAAVTRMERKAIERKSVERAAAMTMERKAAATVMERRTQIPMPLTKSLEANNNINMKIDASIDLLRNKLLYVSMLNNESGEEIATKALHSIDEIIYAFIKEENCRENKDHEEIIIKTLQTTSFPLMNEMIVNNFDNAYVMDNVGHYLNHLFDLAAKLPNGSVVVTALLNSLKIVGQGVEGMVTTARIGDTSPIFALKSSTGIDDLLHEAVVGMYCINNLRHYTPVFTYTYMLLSGSNSYELSSGEIIWNNSNVGNKTYKHLLTEYVPDSETLEDAIKNGLNGEEYFNLFRQVVGALLIGSEKYGLEHGDLHPGNVLVQESPRLEEATVNLGLDDYITTTKLARIIDYGRSSFIFANTRLKIPFIARMEGTAIPLRDAYKLLLYSADIAYHSGNQSVYNVASLIYNFFLEYTDVSLIDMIEIHKYDTNDYYVYRPVIPENRTYLNLKSYLDNLSNIRPMKLSVYVDKLSFDTFIHKIQSESVHDPLLFLLQYEYNQCSGCQTLTQKFNGDFIESIIDRLDLEFTLTRTNYISLMDDAINFLHTLKLAWAYYWAGIYLGMNMDASGIYLEQQTKLFFDELELLMSEGAPLATYSEDFINFINAL